MKNMLTHTIQLEILSYLDCWELLSVSQANRSFYEICKSPCLWMRESIRLFSSENMYPTIANLDWKSVCLRGLSLQSDWKSSSGSILTVSDTQFFSSETMNSLRSPDFVLPPARPEAQCFPTLIQDMLANPLEDLLEDLSVLYYASVFRELLSSNIEFIRNELYFCEEPAFLLELSLGYPSTQNFKSFLMKFLRSFESSLVFFCKFNGNLLVSKARDEEVLEEYQNKWEVYANSAININGLLGPVAEIVYEITGYKLNIAHMMVQIWKREVFETHKARIFECMENILWKNWMNSSREHFYIFEGLVQSMCDLSFNENSIYFKNDNKVKLEGPILELHNFFVSISEQYYSQASLFGILRSLDTDLEQFVLPVTALKIKQIKHILIEQLLYKEIKTIYDQFNCPDKEIRYPLDSPLAISMLKKEGNPRKIAHFLASNSCEYIKIYNQNHCKKNMEDCSTETIAKSLGLPFDAIEHHDRI